MSTVEFLNKNYLFFFCSWYIYIKYKGNVYTIKNKMCTELLLAIIYFITILVVNFFIYKLLKSYYKNISYLLRLKNIYKLYKTEKMGIISNLYLYLKNKNQKILFNLNKFSKNKDIIVIGNIYKFLKTNTINSNLNSFYFKLLEIQYLSLNIDK